MKKKEKESIKEVKILKLVGVTFDSTPLEDSSKDFDLSCISDSTIMSEPIRTYRYKREITKRHLVGK